MKKTFLSLLLLAFGVNAMAQQAIQLRSADKAECVKSDMRSLKASFSFSTIEAESMNTQKGEFSLLSLPNTVIGGNEGDPQIPVVNELIAVPFGATPRIEITSYTSNDYRLEDYGIHKLMPRQPDLFKNQDPKDVPFVYNEAAYQSTRGLHSEPTARVAVNGTLRGVQVGQMSIEPVSYDPVSNTIRVFNNIEVTVHFDGADARATEDMLVNTYSPYFDVLYKQLFNGRSVRDLYEDHPELWRAPVKMLVIANRMFEDCIQDWVAWKTTKGIYVDVNYTDVIGTSADAIKTFIQNKYAQDYPTFLVIMGDKDQVAPSVASASNTSCVADLYYSSVDGDEFVDMYHSRISAETTAQMTTILNKALEYEQYTMPDPSYLNNTLLIAGEDSGWGVTVGRPTIWYATNYYYNAEHGFDNVYEFSHGDYTNCYSYLSSGVGFANYTAHGSKTSWAGPSFDVNDVANLTNAHKYFLAIGNCCQSGDWGYSTTCFGEAMVRAENKGAYAYIGSCPNTTWKNDYYFGVGPTNRADGTMPTYEETGMGIYDAIWMDDAYNTVNSILYVGLLAGNAAQALGYELHSQTLYYWQAYHVIGDGSIMPYRVQPTANQVSHMAILPIGMNTYEVSAVPGSYVAISKDGVLHGTALVDETGTAQVQIDPVTSSGEVTICVTAPNRIPYIQTVPAAALEGAYIAMDSFAPNATHVGDDTNLSITFKNVGTDASTGTTNVTLTTEDPNVTLNNYTGSFGTLAAEATTTVSGFSFSINSGVADGTNVTIHYKAENGNDIYEGNIVIKANEAVLEYAGMAWDGGFTPGETLTVRAKFKNTGHWQATNAQIGLTTSSDYVTVNTQPISVGTIEVGQEVAYDFSITIAANCPETEQLPITFTMMADGGLSATGNETLKNACNVIFNLADSYGDGWNGAKLTVSFDDGSASQELTIASGSSENYTLEIGNGTHVTLTWNSGSYDGECSFSVSYEGDLIIYQSNGTPSAGVLHEFDCNCGIASQTFIITAISSNNELGTVTGGGEFNYGESCTVIATPAEGYMFTNWTQNGEIVAGAGATYTFAVTSDMDLVANFAEGLLIGDGSTDTHQYLPSYNYYTNSFSEQIYTSDELGAAGIITGIAFFNGGAEKTLDYDFYMKATTKDSFTSKTDWIAVSESDKVFSGSVTVVANDWTTITFSTPFVYDGTSNVVLVTDKKTQWSNSPHMSCRVFSTTTTQAIYAYDDNVDFNPMSPSSSSVNNNDMLQVKNQIIVTKTGFDGCVNAAPTSVEVGNITSSAATVTWSGFSESYNVNLGIANVTTLADEDFSNSIPTNWTNDATYPWTIVNGHMQSGNAGVNNSTSSISITVTFPADGTVEFDAECMGEGSSTYYDHCDFFIDDTRELYAGANLSGSGWLHYLYNVTAGEHTFTWSYTKDGSVNPTGDYFAVDNVLVKVGEITWNAPVAVENTEYTFSGLTPETDYCVRVQGVCNDVESAWSELILFSTGEGNTDTQTVALVEGWNWWTPTVEITLADLEAALGTNGLIIKSQDISAVYVASTNTWRNNDLEIEVGKMYKIKTSAACTITLSGIAVDPAEHPITVNSGLNWVGFIGTEVTSLGQAFTEFTPTNLDVVKTAHGTAVYYSNKGWRGTVSTLSPGQGYLYKSKASGKRTFTYPSAE
jgi:gingipain K